MFVVVALVLKDFIKDFNELIAHVIPGLSLDF